MWHILFWAAGIYKKRFTVKASSLSSISCCWTDTCHWLCNIYGLLSTAKLSTICTISMKIYDRKRKQVLMTACAILWKRNKNMFTRRVKSSLQFVQLWKWQDICLMFFSSESVVIELYEIVYYILEYIVSVLSLNAYLGRWGRPTDPVYWNREKIHILRPQCWC